MPILSLCSGYEGLGMAIEALTGDKVAYVADSDKAASLVLAHRFPNAPNIGDITTYDFTQLAGLVDKITAGFSCQDISNAGPREGIDGSRSKIWKDVCRAIRDVRPEYAFLENVAAIRSRGLDIVAEDLAAVGYDLWWTTLRASAVGAAHHRDRWFGIAVPHAEGERRTARRTEPAEQQGQVRRSPGACSELPAYADSPGLEVRCVESSREEQPAPVGSGADPGEADCPTCGCPEGHHDAGGFCAGCHHCTDPELGRPQDAHGPAGPERRGTAPGQAQRGGHGPTLDDEVSFLLPHAHGGGREGRSGDEPEPQGRGEPANSGYSPAEWWGDYLPAIRRWERLIAVPAPAPTELGPRGGRRLTATFAEWLMGIPGHVTDVPGLSRSEQLARIGNGAMPQQAYTAYEYLLHQIKKEAS